ncbi:hypothetical protein KI387_008012, partial [Taxus chinensis]
VDCMQMDTKRKEKNEIEKRRQFQLQQEVQSIKHDLERIMKHMHEGIRSLIYKAQGWNLHLNKVVKWIVRELIDRRRKRRALEWNKKNKREEMFPGREQHDKLQEMQPGREEMPKEDASIETKEYQVILSNCFSEWVFSGTKAVENAYQFEALNLEDEEATRCDFVYISMEQLQEEMAALKNSIYEDNTSEEKMIEASVASLDDEHN